jgi:endonuclease III
MNDLLKVFAVARAFVEKEFHKDLEWSRSITDKPPLDEITLQDFYREYAWVVYCSGFRYEVVNRKWSDLLEAYRYFDPEIVSAESTDVYDEAIKIIGHKGKVRAIIDASKFLLDCNFPQLKDLIKRDLDVLSRKLPYIGDVTKYHLARNLGFDLVKPDVHIARLARYFNLQPLDMCKFLSESCGLSVHEVDTILWRAFEQKRVHFSSEGRIIY